MDDRPPRNEEELTNPTTRIWRCFTQKNEGPYPDHPAKSAFVSTGDDHISVCVVEESWEPGYVPDWINPDWGIAELTVKDLLDAGFVRVVYAETQVDGIEHGHAHAFYPDPGAAAMRKVAKPASMASRFIRRARPPS